MTSSLRPPLIFELFDWSFASSVVQSALGMNIFEVPWVKRKHSAVSFVAGQPLGYHSSWPLFALSHHIVVWQRSKCTLRFTRYAVLGDDVLDVLIADQEVARESVKLLDLLGVKISYHKSLISNTGAAEDSGLRTCR